MKPTDVDTINKLVSKINIKKATGVDQISSKLLRAGAPVLNHFINFRNCGQDANWPVVLFV
jgi:hypothetical protein